MLVMIGSNALKYHINIDRKPKDLDLVGPYNKVISFAKKCGDIRECYPFHNGKKYVIKTNSEIIEAEIAWDGSTASQLVHLVENDPNTIEKDGVLIPSLDVLFTLKMSHRFLKNSPHFLKTMRDIGVMQNLGAKIADIEFFKRREKETYNYNHPKLNVAKTNFFSGDGVRYLYDHDSIHIAMAQLEKPAYKFYQPDNSEVNVSKKYFFEQPEFIRLFGVLEESYVLALERSQIPFGDKFTPKKSFDIALMKVCTSITSGWFREYAWTNYDKVQMLYRDNYVERFWKAVDDGIVKRYQSSDN